MTRRRPFRITIAVVAIAAVALIWLLALPRIDRPDLRLITRARVLLMAAVATLAAAAGLYAALGSGTLRHRLARIALSAGATVFGLVVVEVPTVIAGIDYQARFGTSYGDPWLQLSANGNRLDPELIHVHAPYATFAGRVQGNLAHLGIPDAREYDVDVRYDRNGFRNDRDYTSASVAVIGDSFVEAALLPLDQTVAKRIERRLGEPTVNLGQVAYGLRQELAVLKRYALPLGPKIVLWFFFDGNDLRDIDTYEWAQAHLNQLKVGRRLSDRLLTRNALLALVTRLTPQLDEPLKDARRQSGLFRRADGQEVRLYFDQHLPQWTDKQWSVLTGTLGEARALSERAGARFVLVYVSRKIRIYRDYVRTEPGNVIDSWTTNDLPTVLEAWCREAGIGFVDTIGPMRAAAARGEEPYLPDDVHWGARGHEIAAEAILQHLEAAGLHAPVDPGGVARQQTPP